MATAETRNATGGLPAASPANRAGGPGVHSGAILPQAPKTDKQAVIDRIRAALPELLTADRWVCWRSIPNPDPTKKPKKVPINPHDGAWGSSTDSATWGTFTEAAGWYLGHDEQGPGFALGDGWAGIDMDDCVDDGGNVSPEAWRIIESFNSYTELSPSETGVHILLHGTDRSFQNKNMKGMSQLEVYSSGRYFTVTGKTLVPGSVAEAQDSLDALWMAYAPAYKRAKSNGVHPTPATWGSPDMTLVDDALRHIHPWGIPYGEWVDVLMGIHAEFGAGGLPMAEAWGQGADGEIAKKWSGFKPSGNGTGRVGLGTVFALAKQFGWQRPQAARPAGYQAPVIGEPAPAGAQSPEEKPKRRRITSDDLVDFLRSNGFDFRLNLCDDSIEVNRERITDVHTAKMRCLLRDAGLGKYLAAADDALVAYAASHAYHPVRQYLDGLVWDGFQHIGQLAGHVRDVHGVFGLFLRSWLIGAVNRVMTGGQNAVFVLDGLQGVGKSQLARWLCPLPGFFVDAPAAPDDKDASLMAMRTWIWELSELGATVRRADVESLKSFLSRETFTVRPPFGHFEIKKPGLASFIGTVNESAGIFSDPTGSRRFWATTVTAIDWTYSTHVDVNQVWAEAVHAYRQGESWVLTPEDAKNASAINEGYAVPDAVELLLRKWFVLGAADDNWLSTADILTTLQDNGLGQNARANAMHLAATMKKLGLRKGDFAKQRGYYGVLRSVLPVARQG